MYLENDKTLNEGQQGVVDPKETKEDYVEQDDLSEDDNPWDGSNIAWPSNDEDDEEPTDEDSESEDEDVATSQKPKQDKETNSAFAALRRKEEEIAKREAALRELEVKNNIHSEMLSPEKVWEYADENGISEEMARKILTLEANQKAQQKALEQQSRNVRIAQQKAALNGDPLYEHFKDDVDEILRSNPDVDLEVALDYLVGKNRKNILNLLSKKTEKQTLANVQDKLRRRTMKSNDAEQSDTSNNLSSFARRFNEFAGIDSREVAKHVSKRKKEFF